MDQSEYSCSSCCWVSKPTGDVTSDTYLWCWRCISPYAILIDFFFIASSTPTLQKTSHMCHKFIIKKHITPYTPHKERYDLLVWVKTFFIRYFRNNTTHNMIKENELLHQQLQVVLLTLVVSFTIFFSRKGIKKKIWWKKK